MSESHEHLHEAPPFAPEENIPAEAIQETLEFERAQWESEREALNTALKDSLSVLDEVSDFVIEAIIGLGGEISLMRQNDEIEAAHALKAHLTVYLDRMPTPGKIELEDAYKDMHKAYHDVENEAGIFAKRLREDGYDPQEILDEEAAAAEQFVKTILQGGLVPGLNFKEGIEHIVDRLSLDDTDIDPGDQQL